jgi:catechol 2,3-dioxygenase-like lactoylglutathione lyase family enzyme
MNELRGLLFVSDHRRSAAFYRDVLGFEIAREMTSVAFLNSNDELVLSLFSVAQAAPPARSINGDVVWFVDEDKISIVRQRLIALDALVSEAFTASRTVLQAVDPDGIEFRVICNE